MFGLPQVPDGVTGVEVSSTVLSGDVLFAGSIGRTDLPGGDHGGDAAVAARRRAAAARHDAGAARGTVPPRRWTGSGPRTPICKDWAREDLADQRLSRVPPGRAHRRAALPRRDPRDLRAARVPLDRDARRRARRAAARQGRRCRQGDLRRVAARRRGQRRGRRAGPALRPDGAVRPLRARERRPPAPSRSAATRSRRSGVASARRRAATASSPRPTSTWSTSVRWPRTSRPRCRWSWPRCSAGCRSARWSSRSTTARSPRASISAWASRT